MVHVVGGRHNGEPLATVERYDSESNVWSNIPSMHEARAECAAVTAGDKLYVFGGIGANDDVLDSVECFDSASNSWSMLAPMLERTTRCAAAVLEKKLYVSGGRTSSE